MPTGGYPDHLRNGNLDEVAGGRADSAFAEPVEPLFRAEALAAATDNGLGRPVALFPLPWVLLTVFLLVLALGFALLLATGSYSRKETVVGIVRSAGGEVRVTAPSAGIVTSLFSSEGSEVRAGDRIMSVATLRTGVDGRPVGDVALASLETEIADLKARLAALDGASAFEQQGHQARLAALVAERTASVAVQASTAQRLLLAEQSLKRVKPVAEKGFISDEAMRRRQDEVIGLQQASAEARGRNASLTGQIGELNSMRALQPYTLRQERGRLLDLLAQSIRDRDVQLAQRGYSVVAPTSGVVTALQVGVGQAVDPQRTLMTITVARADAVTAEVYVPSRAIGFLEPGQRVRVRYDAFPYQRFGSASGTVKAISATVLRPAEVQAAIELKEPMYRVIIALEKNSIQAYGKQYKIQSGMALRADIVLERRNFASWLLDPIMAMRGQL